MDNNTQQVASTAPAFIKFFGEPWGIALLAFVTIAGFAVAVFTLFYLKSRKPSYLIRSFTLISSPIEKPDKLKILYDGEPVERLTISRLLFLNDGREAIRREDIASRDRLKIILTPNTKVFGVPKILYAQNDQVTGFGIIKQADDILIDFEFLSKNEGGIIQLVHSGSEKDIRLVGTVIGVKSLYRLINLDYLSFATFLTFIVLLDISNICFLAWGRLIFDFKTFILLTMMFILTIVLGTILLISLRRTRTQRPFIQIFGKAKSEYFNHLNGEWKI